MSAEEIPKSNPSFGASSDTGRLVVQNLVERKAETLVTGRLLFETGIVAQCLPDWGSSLEALVELEEARSYEKSPKTQPNPSARLSVNGLRRAKNL